jgi:hypothetical protein
VVDVRDDGDVAAERIGYWSGLSRRRHLNSITAQPLNAFLQPLNSLNPLNL